MAAGKSGRRDEAMVIVGGGLAGGNAAVTLREEGFEGDVVLVGREPGIPFGRPPLSKTYLRSEGGLDGWYVKPAAWCDEHHVEHLRQSVVTVDPERHAVVLDDGREISYGKLLVATGARNRRLHVPGGELPGIHYLRTVAECDGIKGEAVAGRRAAVVGMSFIGSEVAASLTQLGLRVTTLFPERVPLERVLGAQTGEALAAIHLEKGVELRSETQVTAFSGDERVEHVVTAAGERVPCDLAVVGVGVEPQLPTFATGSLDQTNGLAVDACLRAEVPDVYAAGDIANQLHPVFGRVRVEHYNNGEKQGRAAARAMLGAEVPYDYIHSFWSDQYEHKIEYVGHATKWDQFVVRGSLEEKKLLGFYLERGQLLAAVGLDRGGDPELESDSEMAACARLVGAKAKPDPALLADEGADLWSLGV